MFWVSYDTKKAFQFKQVFLVNECYNYGKNSTLLMQELQLKKTVVTFQFNVSGTLIGSNRDGGFDLSEFRKDTTLIVQGTQSHQHQAAGLRTPPTSSNYSPLFRFV